MSVPILKIYNESTQRYEGIPAIKGEKGDAPVKGVEYWTEEDIQSMKQIEQHLFHQKF